MATAQDPVIVGLDIANMKLFGNLEGYIQE